MKKILITGTLGFIFSNFVRYLGRNGISTIGVDKAVKDYNLDNMYFNSQSHKFYFCDIMDAHNLNNIFTVEKPDIVIGGAAESFVDNSITDILPFLNSNIIGTQNLINACLKHGVEKYVHISTDEVYGQKLDRTEAGWIETDQLKPRNPYSASKACAEHIVIAAHNTHGLQYQITRSCNVFGPRQKKENLIPHIITGILDKQSINIHGDGKNFRQYIFVEDLCSAIMTIIDKGKINSIYNIGDENIYSNLEMMDETARIIGVIKHAPKFITDRKAHDFGYRVNSNKLRDLGWKPRFSFDEGMKETIQFYKGKQ